MKIPPLLTLALLLPALGHAHHGDQFLLLDDYDLPAVGQGYVVAPFEWGQTAGLDSFATEPVLFMTVAPRIALAVSATFLDIGGGWQTDSLTALAYVQLTDPKWDFPLKVSFALGYQWTLQDGDSQSAGIPPPANDSATSREKTKVSSKSASRAVVSASPGAGGATAGPSQGGGSSAPPPPPPPCDPSVDVDCVLPHAGHATPSAPPPAQPQTPPSNTGSTTSSTPKTVPSASSPGTNRTPSVPNSTSEGYLHAGDQWIGRLIIEADFGLTRAVANLYGFWPQDGSGQFGYGVGVSRRVWGPYGVGCECVGDFNAEGYHELIAAASMEPNHHVVLRLGVGFGLTERSPDVTLRTGVVLRF